MLHLGERDFRKRGESICIKSVEILNKALADEPTAVHQYMYFHFHCNDQGYDLSPALFKRTAREEMQHLE